MTQMNVWSYELTAQDIADMARHSENIIGNVVAWSDFYEPADDNIRKVEPSSARTGEAMQLIGSTLSIICLY